MKLRSKGQKGQAGQAVVEYIIIIVVVSVAALVVLSAFSSKIQNLVIGATKSLDSSYSKSAVDEAAAKTALQTAGGTAEEITVDSN